MKNNILFIAHDSSLYGANQSLINMLSSLNSKNIGLTVVFPNQGPICTRFDELDWEYHIIKFRTEICGPQQGIKNKILNFLRYCYKIILNPIALFRLKKLMRIYDINIIHSNSSVISIGLELAKRLNLKHVWHIREYIDLDHDLQVFGGIKEYKIKIQNSSNIICITKGIAKHFNVQDKSHILYDAVRKKSDNLSEPSNSSSKYFMFCGSLAKNKGIEDGIIAFSEFSKSYNDYKLYVAGTGEATYEVFLKEFVAKQNLTEKIIFLGFRDDIDSLMNKSISLLMCSKSEALGRVTIEAMFNKCVVIGFNMAGTKELIKNEYNGFLYDNPLQLVELMKNTALKEIDTKIICDNAFDFAQSNFTEQVFSKKLITIYENLS